jgi:hypothetical protein
MPNYQDGKIYMVWAGNDRYYGSTTNTLSRRLSAHKSVYKNEKVLKKNTCCVLFEKYGVDNCKIELVELFPCNSKMELEMREGFYVRENDCVNRNMPRQTMEGAKELKKASYQKRKEEGRIKYNYTKTVKPPHLMRKKEKEEMLKAHWEKVRMRNESLSDD